MSESPTYMTGRCAIGATCFVLMMSVAWTGHSSASVGLVTAEFSVVPLVRGDQWTVDCKSEFERPYSIFEAYQVESATGSSGGWIALPADGGPIVVSVGPIQARAAEEGSAVLDAQDMKGEIAAATATLRAIWVSWGKLIDCKMVVNGSIRESRKLSPSRAHMLDSGQFSEGMAVAASGSSAAVGLQAHWSNDGFLFAAMMVQSGPGALKVVGPTPILRYSDEGISPFIGIADGTGGAWSFSADYGVAIANGAPMLWLVSIPNS